MKGMKEKQIMVIVKEAGQPPRVEPLFDNTLEAFQQAVGGYIEAVTLTPEVVIICNEEGKLLGLPHNVTISREDFVGTVVVCGVKGEDFSSLRAAAIPLVRALLGG